MARKPETPQPDNAPGGAASAQSDVFMREVDDALRGDELAMFWQRYGRWLILAIVLGLAALAGWLFYQNSVEEAAGIKSEQFLKAVDAAKRSNFDGSLNGLDPVLDADQPGYKAAATLTKAGVLAEQGKKKEAAAALSELAADTTAPQTYRDLALIRQTAIEFDTIKPETVISRLTPLANADSAWFGSAGEMVALAHIKLEQPEKAGPLFADMAKNENIPGTIRERARQMAGVLGIDAVVEIEESETGQAQEEE
ncbi:tetratricopeptide repeat protein [Alterisphingorhabdus coralli]|uniref:Tetratricopeptide repeat protein n=1 Tax=Alterisphingorhabdus coralli TaxID=3071408 RepID=A0AA97F7R3_9SPHN|nr:tetratricopeptide repeat protein [Parasphingorhabdus sp. SCSIO 66989]WOE75959.1 tetratricopeptide repeat protein [Parasphingorhabdus sp. SCSIO 66989]